MRKHTFFLSALLILSLCGTTFADRRWFARSYTAYTAPAQSLEFELWNTGRFGKEAGYYYRFQPRMEFEYGITDRLTGSMYLNFDQRTSAQNTHSSKPFTFSSTSFEFRYRLSDPGQYFVDPALYGEFKYGGDEIEYEAKALFSKRYGNWIGALNVNGEIERKVIKAEHESKFEVTGGIAYEVSPSVALSLELRHASVFESYYEEEEGSAFFTGPTINVQTEKFYFTFNVLRQLAGSPATKDGLHLNEFEQWEVRSILGIAL